MSAQDIQDGASVGRYQLLERLGAGGMGVVHRAWDPELDRAIAIKVIHVECGGERELLRRRLRREARTMAQLRHANVVAVHDVGESEDGQLFVAMEYVQGVSLRRWLRAAPRSGAEILGVLRQAGMGLAAAHAQGIVHRDFKPDNVLVSDDGDVRVLDFGLASSTAPARAESADTSDDTTLTRPGAVVGTLKYMAPEQRRGRPTDARSDQYSFCVTLWQALTGGLPFGRGPSSIARARAGNLAKFERDDLPDHIGRVLARGLSWRPDQRWPDMHALLDALERQPQRRPWLRSWPWLTALAAFTLAVLVSLAWVWPSAEAPSCEPRPASRR